MYRSPDLRVPFSEPRPWFSNKLSSLNLPQCTLHTIARQTFPGAMWKAPRPALQSPLQTSSLHTGAQDGPTSQGNAGACSQLFLLPGYSSFKAQLTSPLSTAKRLLSLLRLPGQLLCSILLPCPSSAPSNTQGTLPPPKSMTAPKSALSRGSSLTAPSHIASRIPHCLICPALLFSP